MRPSARPTKTREEAQTDDQRSVTEWLLTSQKPEIRVIAHMSERQLNMIEKITDLTLSISALENSIGALAKSQEANVKQLYSATSTLAVAISRLTSVVTRMAEQQQQVFSDDELPDSSQLEELVDSLS